MDVPSAFQPVDPRLIRDFAASDIRGLITDIRGGEGTTKDMSGNLRDMVENSGGEIAMRETDDSIILSVASDVLFDFDSAALTDPAQATLSSIAAMLLGDQGGVVQVVGHTDAKGSDAYNQTLSEERAASVVAFLTGQDVPAERLEPVGRGEAEPVAENEIDGVDNPEGRAQNRRVEFILPKE